MVTAGTPGLHVCLPGSIHIDPHQAVDGKGWAWTWDASGVHSTEACTYAFPAFAQMDTVAPILRRWAVNGLDGGDGTAEAARVLAQLDAADATLGRARMAVHGADESDVPSPSAIYGP